MSKLRGALLWLAVAVLFLIANRAAYRGYFNDDDLDNLLQTRGAEARVFAEGLLTPVLSHDNFRPVGHAVYKILGSTAGLHYRPYVALLHSLHLINLWLLWLVARRLGAPIPGAIAGVAFFAFHMACFDAYWKPMFVFDVLCATFVLLAFLLYLHGRWLLALIPFWLAYKSKEPAIALPALLLAYEWLLGERRWKRILPFALVSASFAAQALFRNAAPETAYTLHFTPAALWQTFSFYSSQILLVPFAGALLFPLAFFVKDRRVRFGLLAIAILLGPMWFLPGRLFAVYLYLPLTGAALALAFLSGSWKPAWIAALFALWVPCNYMVMRQMRGVALTTSMENQAYVEQLTAFLSTQRDLKTVFYDGGPERMERWGIEGVVRWLCPDPNLKVLWIGAPESPALLQGRDLAVLSWDRARRRLITAVRRLDSPEVSSITMATGNPVWLFGKGWFPLESGFRWTSAEATARLRWPESASSFFVSVNLGSVQLKDQGNVELELLLDGRSLGTRRYLQQGWTTQRWPLPERLSPDTEITLRSVHPYRPNNGDPRLLGTAITAFGFE